MSVEIISGIFFPDFFADVGNFFAQLFRIEDFNLSGFAQNPADNFVFKGRLQRNDQRTVILTVDLEFFYLLMFIQVKSYRSITMELHTVNFWIFKETVFLGLLQKFLIGFKNIDSKINTGDALNGILITPKDYVETAGEFTVEALDALGHSVNYKEINADNYVNDPDNDGSYVFTGVLASVQEGNYTRAFAARAYIKVVENGVATYYYSDYDAKLNARSIADVAEAAYKDTNPVETEHYKYALDVMEEVEVEGTLTTVTKTVYSPYTVDQRKTLLGFFELGEQ